MEGPPALPSTYASKRIGANTTREGGHATTTTKDGLGRPRGVVSSAGRSKRAKIYPSTRSQREVQPARHRRDEIK